MRKLIGLSLLTFSILGATSSFAQTRFPMRIAQGANVLWPASNVIDGNMGTAFTSNFYPSSNPNYGSTWLAAWLTGPQNVQTIVLGARMYNGQALGFPASYNVFITAPDNSKWNYIGNFNTQPDKYGNARINLPSAVQTYGVWIIPTVLGVDNYNNHYFQMAEVQLYGAPVVSNSYGGYMFTANGSGYLVSQGHACGFTSWQAYVNAGGGSSALPVVNTDNFPANIVYDGACPAVQVHSAAESLTGIPFSDVPGLSCSTYQYILNSSGHMVSWTAYNSGSSYFSSVAQALTSEMYRQSSYAILMTRVECHSPGALFEELVCSGNMSQATCASVWASNQ